MATAVKNLILDDIKARVAAIVDDESDTLFMLVSRGHGIQPAQNQRPAAFISALDDRPVSQQFEESTVQDLVVGITVFGLSTDFTNNESELVDIEARLIKGLEGYKPSGTQFEITHRMTLGPMANQNIPQGSLLVSFLTRYYTLRGQPYNLS